MADTNGLTPREEKALRQTLRQLDEILTRRFLMGGNEARGMLDLAARIRVRLTPPTVGSLVDEARELIDRGGLRHHDWVKEALKRARAA